jgi:hypothetical protein
LKVEVQRWETNYNERMRFLKAGVRRKTRIITERRNMVKGNHGATSVFTGNGNMVREDTNHSGKRQEQGGRRESSRKGEIW